MLPSFTIMTDTVNITPEPILDARVRDYFSLLKPRVMSLVVFTGLCGLLLAPGDIHPFLGMVAVFCIALGSGAAGAINMWYDRDIDAIMTRTQKRPIPAGRMASASALEFGVILASASVILMALALNLVAAALLAGAILFYVVIYTMWLKRSTPQNIVIGGAAGAFPPMIGWAAVTGNVSIDSIILFAIIFMWTPPHFWALALYRSDDYKLAGIPMLPVTAGAETTRKHIVVYTLLLVATTLLPTLFKTAGFLYGFGALALGVWFLYLAVRLYKSYTEKLAKQTFGFSILYLFAIFGLLLLDHYL